VNANQADAANAMPVHTMCRVLNVSTSGYYAWLDRAPPGRTLANAALLERIRAVHAESDGTYGRARVCAELRAHGLLVNAKRVAALMRQDGLQGVSRRRGFVVTTQRDKAVSAKTADLVNRAFHAEGPNRLWVADITYVPTWAGFIYLAIVLDVWSRRIVGWAIGEDLRGQLVLAALNMALATLRAKGVIHHNDQGSQYTSLEFGKRCGEMGVRPSMGSVGDAYDNAMAESFFATLECELIARRSWRTKAEARMALFSYIEGWYNPRRRHSALGQCSPMQFEEKNAQAFAHQPPCREHGLPTVGACVAGATPPVDNPAAEVIEPA